MAKIRIIPSILWKGASSVKGTQFNPWRVLGPVNPALNIYIARNVDEIIIQNILPNINGSIIDYKSLERFIKNCNLPLTYGGGISTFGQVDALLKIGVDKVCLCSAALKDPNFVKKLAREFGSQFVVASLDYRNEGKKKICYSNNGREKHSGELVEHVQRMEDFGVGEILITSIDREGMMSGYDFDAIASIREKTNKPLLVNGGANSISDFLRAADLGVDGLVASSTFLFSEVTPRLIAEKMHQKGFNVRRIV